VAVHLKERGLIDLLDQRIAPIDCELGPLAHADARSCCWTRSRASVKFSG
jgi:hypothetical protein